LTTTTATAPFDMSQVQRGARNRRTPYYEATQRYGPKGFTVYNHMYFPIRFDSFEAEFEALLTDVTIWDVSVERCLEISGPDGFRFAQLRRPATSRSAPWGRRSTCSSATRTAGSSTTRC
jgi:glycine cleavage system aminomethyltransferase T